MARIEHFVDTGTMGRTGLKMHDLDKFLGWMTQVSDQNWVDISNVFVLRSYRSLRLSLPVVIPIPQFQCLHSLL